jgi:hypothetical protein
MANPSSSSTGLLTNRIGRQFGMLITLFLLGMAVNLIGSPSSSVATWSERIVLLLHVVIAIALVINAVYIARIAKGGAGEKLARGGAAAVRLAFAFGPLTVAAPPSNLWSFGMAAAFISAFTLFGKLFMTVKSVAKDHKF